MIKKFGMLAVLGALLGGIVLAGCSGSDDSSNDTANTTAPPKKDTGDAQ